jgi:hypothetical protein
MAEFADNDEGADSRLQYLKDHGVEVETVEDRRAAEEKASKSSGEISAIMAQLAVSLSGPANGADTKFILIPHDTSKPMRQLSLTAKEGVETNKDAIPNYVKPYFADSNSIDASLLAAQATKQFASGDMKDLAKTNISTAAMNRVAATGSVETFPLVHPADTNKFTGVYIYLDEVGLLKKLPPNVRATQIAAACGYNPPPNFYGDVFIGRCQTKPAFTNLDFLMDVDTDRGAEWMRRAVSENLEYQQAMNQITGNKNSQPAKAGEDGNVVEEMYYSWTQTDDEIEIVFKFEDDCDKKKFNVKFMPQSVKVMYDGKQAHAITLYSKVDCDGCTWTVDGKRKLVVTFEKADAGVSWPRISDMA